MTPSFVLKNNIVHIKRSHVMQFVKVLTTIMFFILAFPGLSIKKPVCLRNSSLKKFYRDHVNILWRKVSYQPKTYSSKNQTLFCNTSIKERCLHSHLADFPEKLGPANDEHGERFHQNLKVIEGRCQGRWDEHNMMTEYCWSTGEIKHCWKGYKSRFLPQ